MKKSKSKSDGKNSAQPTEEQIRQRAHEIFLERGGAHGSDLDDWLEAEQQLKQKPKPEA